MDAHESHIICARVQTPLPKPLPINGGWRQWRRPASDRVNGWVTLKRLHLLSLKSLLLHLHFASTYLQLTSYRVNVKSDRDGLLALKPNAKRMKNPKHKRSPCPVACTLDLIGDKWTLLIIRDLLFGKRYYKDFCQSPEKIATNILADRLGKIVEYGLAEKWFPDEGSGREAYRLTAKRQSLKSVLESVANWGLSNVKGTEAKLAPKSK